MNSARHSKFSGISTHFLFLAPATPPPNFFWKYQNLHKTVEWYLYVLSASTPIEGLKYPFSIIKPRSPDPLPQIFGNTEIYTKQSSDTSMNSARQCELSGISTHFIFLTLATPHPPPNFLEIPKFTQNSRVIPLWTQRVKANSVA